MWLRLAQARLIRRLGNLIVNDFMNKMAVGTDTLEMGLQQHPLMPTNGARKPGKPITLQPRCGTHFRVNHFQGIIPGHRAQTAALAHQWLGNTVRIIVRLNTRLPHLAQLAAIDWRSGIAFQLEYPPLSHPPMDPAAGGALQTSGSEVDTDTRDRILLGHHIGHHFFLALLQGDIGRHIATRQGGTDPTPAHNFQKIPTVNFIAHRGLLRVRHLCAFAYVNYL